MTYQNTTDFDSEEQEEIHNEEIPDPGRPGSGQHPDGGRDQWHSRGKLTIKNTTKEVELRINLLGIADLPPEMQEMMNGVVRVASFEAATTVDRRDFEVGVANWAQTMIVGGDVDITIGLEANHK